MDALLNIVFLQFGFVTSEGEWLLVRVVLDSLPPVTGDGAETDKAVPVLKPSRSVIADHPWLLDLYGWRERAHSSAGASRACGSSKDTADAASDEEGEETALGIDDVWSELHARRKAVAAEQPVAEAFVWSVLGGAWTAKNKGVCFDAYKGRNATATAKAWARQYSLCPTAGFSGKKHGDHGAQLLAETWAARMSFLLRLRLPNGHRLCLHTGSHRRGKELG